MKPILLFLFLTLPFSIAGADCGRDLASVPAPTGMTAADLATIVGMFENDPAFAKAEAIIIYGSRTHFSYGFPAHEGSDLDFMMTAADGDRIKGDAYSSWIESANTALAPLALGLRIEINHLPLSASTESFSLAQIDKNLLTVQSLEEMADFWEWWRPRLLRQVPPGKRKSVWLRVSGDIFNKEAIFILRDSPANRSLADSLARKHYPNVLFTD